MARNFNVPSDEMLEDANTKLALFADDKADFVAFDIEFDDPFELNMGNSIEASEDYESSETRQDVQQQETAEVLEAMKLCRDAFAVAKYFIEKGFAALPDTMAEFGLDNSTESFATQAGTVSFMGNIHKLCNSASYKPVLLAAGMTQPQIDNLKTQKDNLKAKNKTQNKFIVETPEATALRDAQYNSTFAFVQKLNRASKVVYINNLVKMNQYNLPHGSEGADFNVEGKVTDGSNENNPLKGVLVRLTIAGVTPTILEVLTNFYGNWGFEGVPAGNHTLEFIREGYTTVSNVPCALPAGEKVVVNQTMVLA